MLLEHINNPQDLKKLTAEELAQLAGEVRGRIIEVVSKTGGHLASSLGAVELIIALHYCLDTPQDKIIFDVLRHYHVRAAGDLQVVFIDQYRQVAERVFGRKAACF